MKPRAPHAGVNAPPLTRAARAQGVQLTLEAVRAVQHLALRAAAARCNMGTTQVRDSRRLPPSRVPAHARPTPAAVQAAVPEAGHRALAAPQAEEPERLDHVLQGGERPHALREA
jgi:hypothetical protein